MRDLNSATDATKESAAGLNEVLYSIVRQLAAAVIESLLKIFNIIWTQKAYPNLRKEAIVIPLLTTCYIR